MRGRGLHLDDDVPIVTPTVQQTGEPADAAEAHMSMGEMELISDAAAKMMNAAVKSELTSAQGLVRGKKTRWATSSSRLAALLERKHAGENRRVRLLGRNEMIAASMYSPKFVNETLRVLGKQLIDDGRLDSVSLYSAGPTADFPELDTREWHEDDYDQQGNLLDPIKVKEGKREEIEWVLKQKLFDYVPQSECTERQGRPYSLKWVLKNKGEKVRARLVVREIKKAKSEYEKL